ncbi:hypothetical protein AMTR_s00175p00038630, partial [Amborella trichopoda]
MSRTFTLDHNRALPSCMISTQIRMVGLLCVVVDGVHQIATVDSTIVGCLRFHLALLPRGLVHSNHLAEPIRRKQGSTRHLPVANAVYPASTFEPPASLPPPHRPLFVPSPSPSPTFPRSSPHHRLSQPSLLDEPSISPPFLGHPLHLSALPWGALLCLIPRNLLKPSHRMHWLFRIHPRPLGPTPLDPGLLHLRSWVCQLLGNFCSLTLASFLPLSRLPLSPPSHGLATDVDHLSTSSRQDTALVEPHNPLPTTEDIGSSSIPYCLSPSSAGSEFEASFAPVSSSFANYMDKAQGNIHFVMKVT